MELCWSNVSHSAVSGHFSDIYSDLQKETGGPQLLRIDKNLGENI